MWALEMVRANAIFAKQAFFTIILAPYRRQT
jgi:hypothetical protein